MLTPAARCSICSESDHHANKCPTLCEPLKEGFYKPSGGHQGGHDDDDEKVKMTVNVYIKQQANLKHAPAL
jgi:hypothetical protein